VVTLHVPVTADTKGMVSAEFLSHLRPGTFLVNTSRGDLIDEGALLDIIDEKELRVGLDVFADEPAEGEASFDSALARHPRVYATHHIGASTEQAQAAIADAVVTIFDDFARGVVRDCVNVRDEPKGTIAVSVRHLNRVGVLARILTVLRNAGLNVEQMQNRVFDGGVASTATIHVSGELDVPTMDLLKADEDVIGVSVGGR
jgi:D-3-phosphoglycerate dehydrogenase